MNVMLNCQLILLEVVEINVGDFEACRRCLRITRGIAQEIFVASCCRRVIIVVPSQLRLFKQCRASFAASTGKGQQQTAQNDEAEPNDFEPYRLPLFVLTKPALLHSSSYPFALRNRSRQSPLD